jgi:hypothetical protein
MKAKTMTRRHRYMVLGEPFESWTDVDNPTARYHATIEIILIHMGECNE